MRIRSNDHQQRKDLVLGIVVNEYIKTVNPISSGFIKQEYLFDLSPATIRNVLAELENDGFLTHPHTSAGRVPTQVGYRYYVDNLMKEIQFLEEEKERIKAEYVRDIKSLEHLLEKTSEAISDYTHYTSIISIDGQENKIFCKGIGNVVEYLDMNNLTRMRDILDSLERKERLVSLINRRIERKIEVYIGQEMALRHLEDCSLVISRYQANRGPSGRIAILGPTRMDYQKVVSALDYFSRLMNEML